MRAAPLRHPSMHAALTLRAVALDQQPLSQPLAARFDGHGTVGRAEHNTLALPDPARLISRHQLELQHDAAGWWLRNIGASHRVMLDGRRLPHGAIVALRSGSLLRVGAYRLSVVVDADADADADAPGMPDAGDAAHERSGARPSPDPDRSPSLGF